MKAGYGKTVRPVCAADGGKLFIGRLLRPDSGEAGEQRRSNPSAEPVERRAGTKGNADQQSTCRTQSREQRVTGAGTHTESAERFAVTHPRWEPYAGKPHVRFCAGGAQQ